jgi:hypothetical protein
LLTFAQNAGTAGMQWYSDILGLRRDRHDSLRYRLSHDDKYLFRRVPPLTCGINIGGNVFLVVPWVDAHNLPVRETYSAFVSNKALGSRALSLWGVQPHGDCGPWRGAPRSVLIQTPPL